MMYIEDSNGRGFSSFEDFERYYEKKALKARNWFQQYFYNFYSGEKDFKLFSVHFVLFNTEVKDCKRGILHWTLDDFDNVVSGVEHYYTYSL